MRGMRGVPHQAPASTLQQVLERLLEKTVTTKVLIDTKIGMTVKAARCGFMASGVCRMARRRIRVRSQAPPQTLTCNCEAQTLHCCRVLLRILLLLLHDLRTNTRVWRSSFLWCISVGLPVCLVMSVHAPTRKHSDGKVAELANALTSKWKEVVKARGGGGVGGGLPLDSL